MPNHVALVFKIFTVQADLSIMLNSMRKCFFKGVWIFDKSICQSFWECLFNVDRKPGLKAQRFMDARASSGIKWNVAPSSSV